MDLKEKLAALQGPAMIAFSVACIGAAALVHQAQQSGGLAMDIATATPEDCMAIGFDTPEGRVGCLTQVILPMDGAPFDESDFE